MNRLTIITFLYAQPRKWRELGYGLYNANHVNALARACAANISIPHRFICLTDTPDGIQCETMPVFPAVHVEGEDACYRRLQAFDAKWQASLNTEFVLMLDLDAVFLRDATVVIKEAMKSDLTIMRGSEWSKRQLRGTLCSYYNGSMWLCRSGSSDYLWREFNPETFYAQRDAFKMPNGQRPLGSDQAWYSVRLGTSANMFKAPDIVQYRTMGANLTEAAIVFFAGNVKPWTISDAGDKSQLGAIWRRYAEDKIKVYRKYDGGRCLVLGNLPSVWSDVDAALDKGPFAGVVAAPEVTQFWPGQVDAIGISQDHATRIANERGFDDLVLCGFEIRRDAA